MTDAVVENPGLEASFIGLLRTVYGTMRTFIGIADAIMGAQASTLRRGARIGA